MKLQTHTLSHHIYIRLHKGAPRANQIFRTIEYWIYYVYLYIIYYWHYKTISSRIDMYRECVQILQNQNYLTTMSPFRLRGLCFCCPVRGVSRWSRREWWQSSLRCHRSHSLSCLDMPTVLQYSKIDMENPRFPGAIPSKWWTFHGYVGLLQSMPTIFIIMHTNDMGWFAHFWSKISADRVLFAVLSTCSTETCWKHSWKKTSSR